MTISLVVVVMVVVMEGFGRIIRVLDVTRTSIKLESLVEESIGLIQIGEGLEEGELWGQFPNDEGYEYFVTLSVTDNEDLLKASIRVTEGEARGEAKHSYSAVVLLPAG